LLQLLQGETSDRKIAVTIVFDKDNDIDGNDIRGRNKKNGAG
jgi:hypothetical protein